MKVYAVRCVKCLIGKSFCWGILVASLTWFMTLLLYFHLVQDTKRESIANSQSIEPFTTSAKYHIIDRHRKSNVSSVVPKPSFTHHLDDSPGAKYSIMQSLGDVNKYGVINNLEDQHVRDMGYKNHAFNALVSNNIGIFRNIPDTRHKICKVQIYDEDLPSASIVMCFFNEHKMTLLRSIKSILERTPFMYLKEIILVDDCSDSEDLLDGLLDEVSLLNKTHKIKYIRNPQREGLIRARVIGARHSIGDVIIFLDSHIEVNNKWVEPLLHIVKHENSTLAVPVIDIISPDTFEYSSSPLVRGGFNWGLHFKWENLPDGTLKNESSFAGPFKSPTMAGGLFAVSRKYFTDIGEYDVGMDIWGGENIEISFRVWQCGGAIKILPCSRVGHIFRKRRPYSSPGGENTMLRNSIRLAYVWMDDYKEYFFKHQKIKKDFDYGNIDDRLELRNQLHCKNFSWYINNVYPELSLPGEQRKVLRNSKLIYQPWHSRKRTYLGSFLMRLSDSNLCASVIGPKINGFYKRGNRISLQTCMKTRNQIWYETDKSEIILDKLFCLEASMSSNYAYPVIGKCHEMLGDQQWKHTSSENSPVYNMATGTCLKAEDVREGATLELDLCTKRVPNSWDIIRID